MTQTPVLIILTGPCGVGKTTLCQMISDSTGIELISGDQIKDQMFPHISDITTYPKELQIVKQAIFEHAKACFHHAKSAIIDYVIVGEAYIRQFQEEFGESLFLKVLLPNREIVYQRDEERDCWTSGREMIDFLYEKYTALVGLIGEEHYIDNGREAIEQTYQSLIRSLPVHSEQVLNKDLTFENLPPIWPHSLIGEIRSIHEQSGRRLVILDDDPTGTQTVHDVPLLTEWSIPVLKQELQQSNTFFILTNSRSLPEAKAQALNIEIGQHLKIAAMQVDVEFFVLSRSDSTLRGHYPAEVDALCEGIDYQPDATVMVPYFEAGGRYTIGDTHYVHMGEELVPASQTEFAKDKSFPYSYGYLPKYVEEKTKGRISAGQVYSIDLHTIRTGGPTAVFDKLMRLPDGGVIVLNAAHDRDMAVAVRGLLMAQDAGKQYIYRTAASFVSALAGISLQPLLTAQSMRIHTQAGGILLVGSHVQKSTDQLNQALQLPNITAIELEVEKLLESDQYDALIESYSQQIHAALYVQRDVIAYTSRKLIATKDAASSLAINRKVSAAVVELVKKLSIQPKFLIAKGGITANDVATKGLGVRRAMIAGQLQPGIPVWYLGEEAKFPHMHYVVYPGNVGTVEGLADAIRAFRGHTT